MKLKLFHKEEGSVYTRDLLRHPHVTVGEHTYGLPVVHSWDDTTKLRIGKFCSIADEVHFLLGGNHRSDWVSTYPFNVLHEKFPNAAAVKGHPATKGDIVVGNDVWIGSGALILSGVTIGDGAVIGAHAVVGGNVAPYEIVVGNPMKSVRKRFSEAQIKDLLDIAWWNWDEEKINENVQLICSENIQQFIDKHKRRV